ncbi:hypothetical protein [Faecalicatena contorta]|uniref:hypothetical protein n=1 Tax=Faecalicatena contorta TaxID=39482 RepID=UPI001F331DA5|nr:hypothetical protein [Faecalicatena contorta]MCF2682678.1 hypothetical protein [Faecalicatena contorta]
MTGKELFEKLLESYRSSFDIERNYDIDGDTYDAHAAFNVTSSKYVLVKKAELWRAECFEHVFFRVTDELQMGELKKFREEIDFFIEPQLVRGGEKLPLKDHMYTYMTAIYICENGASDDVQKAVRQFKYMKNYLFTIRGYSEARILVFDMKNCKIYGNHAAKDMVKGYKKANII